MEIIRDNCDRATWDNISADAGQSALEQSWIYGEAVCDHYGMTTKRAVIRSDGKTLGIFQIFENRFLGVANVNRLMRGPIWIDRHTGNEQQEETITVISWSFSLLRRDLLFWTPDLSNTDEHLNLMRKVGKRRMVTGLITSWLDLTKTGEELLKGFSGNWRNMLRAGERAELKIRIRDDGKGVRTHLSAYDAFRKQKRFIGPPSELIQSMSEHCHKGDIITLTAGTAQQIIAGVLFVQRGDSATYYTSWNSDEVRNNRAHNVLLWRFLICFYFCRMC